MKTRYYRWDIFLIYSIVLAILIWSLIPFRINLFTISTTILICGIISESLMLREYQTKKIDNGLFLALAMSALIIISFIFFKKDILCFNSITSSKVFAALFLCIAVFITLLSFFTLKKLFSYSLTIENNHQLIIHGIYKIIRHPSYLGTGFYILGISFLYQTLPAFIALGIFIPVTLLRIKKEENMLLSYFGEEYSNYQLKSKMLIPFIY